ncbi:MAG TPA: chemotaxis protein CheW [Gemmatimonadaceae bacterium]|nr:chemotaxis protein CheW [Gemmatimonadaceae bacterium]
MTTTLTQLVTFRLGDDLFAADISSVERVLRYQTPTPIPNVPPWIAGVVEYQKRVLPVIDMRSRFEMAAEPVRPETRFLVFHIGDDWIAAQVDAVLEVISALPAEVAPPPPLFRGLAGEYLRGVVRRKDRLIVLLDATRLLTATERLHLDAVIDERLIVEHSGEEA